MAPYNLFYPGQRELFRRAGLNPANNFWSQVFDFNKEKDVHWSMLSPRDFIEKVEKTFPG